MRVLSVLSAILLVVGIAGCASEMPPEEAGFMPAPHATLAQLMRGIPFPNSNLIFDTQDLDPESGAAEDEAGVGATNLYGDIYGGWQGVENASLALAETATLIMIPGRFCENGLPVPLGDEQFRAAAQGLIDAGLKAYEVAKTRDLDEMLIVGGDVSDACAACHEPYRDVPEGQMRCVPMSPAAD